MSVRQRALALCEESARQRAQGFCLQADVDAAPDARTVELVELCEALVDVIHEGGTDQEVISSWKDSLAFLHRSFRADVEHIGGEA